MPVRGLGPPASLRSDGSGRARWRLSHTPTPAARFTPDCAFGHSVGMLLMNYFCSQQNRVSSKGVPQVVRRMLYFVADRGDLMFRCTLVVCWLVPWRCLVATKRKWFHAEKLTEQYFVRMGKMNGRYHYFCPMFGRLPLRNPLGKFLLAILG